MAEGGAEGRSAELWSRSGGRRTARSSHRSRQAAAGRQNLEGRERRKEEKKDEDLRQLLQLYIYKTFNVYKFFNF